MKEIWVEKYRPTDLIDIHGQDAIKAEMASIIEGEAPMQHFLFHSPGPGTGKTTMARLMAHNLGYQLHEFNASSKRQRGIDFVEDDVLPMSRTGQWETLFLLDEADRITVQGQDALKGVIENAQGYFILTCNDLNKVSPWLQSRCQVRTFEPIAYEAVLERLKQICVYESVEIGSDEVALIAGRHMGDMRNAIGCLQAASYLDGEARLRFINRISIPKVDATGILRACFTTKDIDEAVALLGDDIKTAIDAVFDKAVESRQDAERKMTVIDASITSRRDLIMGIPDEYVRYNFIRMMIGS